MSDLAGKQHVFPDGVILRVIQVKDRNDGPWIIYETEYTSAMPKRFSERLDEFIGKFGHLFGYTKQE